MYITTICPSYLIFVALITTFIHSATSHPFQTSEVVKPGQYQDPNSRGLWKVLENDEHRPLSDPARANHDYNPTWRTTNHDSESTTKEHPDHTYTKEIFSIGNPDVRVLVPALPHKIPKKTHKQYTEHMKEKSEHKSELEESTINAIAADKQNRYNEILRYMHAKNAASHENSEKTPAYISLSSSSGRSVSIFSYRFWIPTLGLKTARFPQHSLPVTTVIILLVMVWIAIFIIGVVELCNYVWSRWVQNAVGSGNGEEEQNVELDELMKMPLRVVAIPSEATHVRSLIEHEYEFLNSVSSETESDSEGSDEDDYRIF